MNSPTQIRTPVVRKKILLGIQARSGSARLPGKIGKPMNGKPMLSYLIQAAENCSRYVTEKLKSATPEIHIAVLCPYGDEVAKSFRSSTVMIVEGPEQDVLGRYQIAAEALNPDLIVRLTGDCPDMPPFVITNILKDAIRHDYDYLSNAWEKIRTHPDGWDCEVFSRRLLEFAYQHATDPSDREHVTPFMRNSSPAWARLGAIIGHIDLSEIRVCVDTDEDFENVSKRKETLAKKIEAAHRMFGKHCVHRL